MSELLRIEVEQQEASALVGLSGELDMVTAKEFRALLAELERDGRTPPHLVLDLRKLTFIDSTGVEAVIRTEARCRRQGTQLTVIKAPPQIHRVFVLTGIDTLVALVDEWEP